MKPLNKPFHIKRPSLSAELNETDDLLTIIEECRTNEEDIHHRYIKNVCMEHETFGGVEWNGVIFENCTLTNCSFAKSTFDNVRFKSCNFSNSDFSDSWLNCCEFDLVKSVGADFGKCTLFNVAMADSNFKYAKFTSSKFDTCSIHNSELSEAYFAECGFKTMELHNSVFIRTDFFKTSLSKLDFSSCVLQGITISDDHRELRGAVVNSDQATELSRFLGIIIKDD